MKPIDLNINSLNHANEISGSTPKMRDHQLREQSQQLESIFLTQMIKVMERTVPNDGLTGGSKNSLSTMMFSNVLGQAMSERGGVGLADMIYKYLDAQDSPVSHQSLNTFDFLRAFDQLNSEELSK